MCARAENESVSNRLIFNAADDTPHFGIPFAKHGDMKNENKFVGILVLILRLYVYSVACMESCVHYDALFFFFVVLQTKY